MNPFLFGLILLSASAQAEETKCHPLKFDSYFVAQNVQGNIKKINPDLNHANFDGNYVLVRAELAMETLYLIASCNTGEFYHEKLSADRAIFSVSGPSLELSDKNETTHYEWDGSSWIKGESKTATENANTIPNTSGAVTVGLPPTNSPSPTPNMLSAYQKLFALYPAQETLTTCAPIDFSSNFRAAKDKDVILKHTPDLKHPDFAGSKILLKTEAIFETVTLVADCKTGKISDDFLVNHVTYRPDSRLVIVNSSDTHPELKIWSENQWIQIPDPVQKNKGTVSNTLYGQKAMTLSNSLPNPEHIDVVRFENLPATSATVALFKELGASSIVSGKCKIPHGQKPVCEVETQ